MQFWQRWRKSFNEARKLFQSSPKLTMGIWVFWEENETLWICSSRIVECTFDRRAREKLAKKLIFCWIFKNKIYTTCCAKEVSPNFPLDVYVPVLTTIPKKFVEGAKFLHPKSKNINEYFLQNKWQVMFLKKSCGHKECSFINHSKKFPLLLWN